ncbi:MAG: FKBP-type peptidyl-prolyl cis-trans isomerase [Desulfuromonadales bacterium]|nr:FKBP-type peptidyl-prolyl cis-trans isomerase [Desulfuromonadales bacterium]
MTKHVVAVVVTWSILVLASGCTAEEKKAGQKVELKDLKDKVSYAIGLNIGRDFKQQEIDIDPDLLAQGIRDAVAGVPPQLTDEQVQETITAFQKEMIATQEKKATEMAEKNLKEGEAFLAETAKQEGVVTLPSGLMYKVIEEGTGPKPSAGDTVTVHYEGRLVDGTVFDSSLQRGEPATFPVSGVIPGWTEALQQMNQGAKYELYIPAKLAYGERGAGPVIGPNATLIFNVELLEIQAQNGGAAKPAPK